MLTERISQLSHLQKNIHDFSSRQGLLKMIGRRKRLLSYVRGKSEQRYSDLIGALASAADPPHRFLFAMADPRKLLPFILTVADDNKGPGQSRQ